MENKKLELPWWQKYTLSLEEASEYFGIGYKKLRLFARNMLMRSLSCGMETGHS